MIKTFQQSVQTLIIDCVINQKNYKVVMEDIIIFAMLVGQFPNYHLQPNYNLHDFQIID